MNQYTVDLDQISFSYENTAVLNRLSLKVRSGEHIGIVGDSGCGKSTILKIIAGLYEADDGRVSIAGESEPWKIREQVALVMQHNSLFPLSVRDNITCGHLVPEDRIWNACQNASLTEWIKSLPHGLDTNVGERGGKVSGGQAQRIQIARALCKNAPVILLDEPASALDRDTGDSVLKALKRLMDGKTVIHVTHHPETLDSSYIIYRLKGGKLIHE
ncbi:MAG: ATP-binding cassette domain-containing protein [Lachnospiraceae bacterium]|nr:ATP-binding cassette domain-containing protein [Lachnospiraceae bacterium]